VLMARRLARRGVPGTTRISVDRRPTTVNRLSTEADPPTVIAAAATTEDIEVREVPPVAWTALDDLQLDRLLNEASS
jgi:hypothetical protein